MTVQTIERPMESMTMENIRAMVSNVYGVHEMNENDIKMTIGSEYVNGYFLGENGEFVEEAYKEIARINEILFEKIPFKVVFTEDDSYKSAKEMRDRVQKEKVIYIYKGNSEHEFLTPEQNWKGRAIHDVFAHLVCGCPFSFQGELNAYYEQRKHYPEWVWNVLFAEIPAQTSAYYYCGNFEFKQRAIIAPRHWQIMSESLKKDYSENSILKPEYFDMK